MYNTSVQYMCTCVDMTFMLACTIHLYISTYIYRSCVHTVYEDYVFVHFLCMYIRTYIRTCLQYTLYMYI